MAQLTNISGQFIHFFTGQQWKKARKKREKRTLPPALSDGRSCSQRW